MTAARATDLGTHLETCCLQADATLGDALRCLRRSGLGLAVVVDREARVIGTLRDSDIRRVALKGTLAELRVADAMAERPILAEVTTTDEELAELLSVHRLRCVPVVDDDRLVGFRSANGFPGELPAPTAVIMAGGRGARLRPITDKVPKPLLRVGSTSIVERLIAGFAAAGVREVFLAVSYKAEAFEERLGDGQHLGLGVTIHYIREEQPMGTAGALGLLPPGRPGPLLVTNGDIVTTIDFRSLIEFHWRHRGAVTVAGAEHLSHIPYGVLRYAEHHLLSIEEKPVRRDFCSAGIYVLDPEVKRFVSGMAAMDMPDLIAAIIAEGLPAHVFPILEKWYDIGGTAEFERVLMDFATGEEE